MRTFLQHSFIYTHAHCTHTKTIQSQCAFFSVLIQITMKDKLKTMEMNEKQTNNWQTVLLQYSNRQRNSYIQTPAITIKTASYIANCNNGIRINAPMRMGNQRQKVTNWYFVLFCFIRSLRLEDTWEWERGRHTKTLDK